MIIIENKYIPIRGFSAMAIWPFIFIRIDCKIYKYTINHEKIHFAQQKELFFIGFYILYLFYHLKYGYDNNPFEREAYLHQKDEQYLLNRTKYHWRTYGNTGGNI